jgi:osmoprotectant transport system permease protein
MLAIRGKRKFKPLGLLLRGAYQYFLLNQVAFWQVGTRPLELSPSSLRTSNLVSIPLSIWITHHVAIAQVAINILTALRVIPSLAFFVLLIHQFRLGVTSVVIALLVCNWVIGLTSIDRSILEAARGVGMNSWQRFWKAEFPLVLPLLPAGIRPAALSTISIVTIAAYINVTGLGTPLFVDVTTANYDMIFTGGVAVSALAVGVNYLPHFLERQAEIHIRAESH